MDHFRDFYFTLPAIRYYLLAVLITGYNLNRTSSIVNKEI